MFYAPPPSVMNLTIFPCFCVVVVANISDATDTGLHPVEVRRPQVAPLYSVESRK